MKVDPAAAKSHFRSAESRETAARPNIKISTGYLYLHNTAEKTDTGKVNRLPKTRRTTKALGRYLAFGEELGALNDPLKGRNYLAMA